MALMFNLKIHPAVYLLFFLSGLTGKFTPVLLSFCAVLLHEAAHLVTALGFGYHTLCIELFPFGGVARMEASLFNDPVAEAVTAFAGPLESLTVALLLWSFVPFLKLTVLEDFARINLGIGLFNLLPLFPLDGGRILRSLLIRKQGYKRATRLTLRWTRRVIFITGLPLTALVLKKVVPVHLPLLLFFLLLATGEQNHTYAYLAQHTKKKARLDEKGLLLGKVWVVEEKRTIGEVLPFLTGKNYHLFFLVDKHGKILGEVTEDEVVNMINRDNLFNLRIGELRKRSGRRLTQAGGKEDR
ncbi:MAG TPA: hypothetical protein GXZ98_06100 [Firmicutes bacterium]|jgi:stage IV sporulation protein FB|nr:hypothetical protein [Bacillota bacterium]